MYKFENKNIITGLNNLLVKGDVFIFIFLRFILSLVHPNATKWASKVNYLLQRNKTLNF